MKSKDNFYRLRFVILCLCMKSVFQYHTFVLQQNKSSVLNHNITLMSPNMLNDTSFGIPYLHYFITFNHKTFLIVVLYFLCTVMICVIQGTKICYSILHYFAEMKTSPWMTFEL